MRELTDLLDLGRLKTLHLLPDRVDVDATRLRALLPLLQQAVDKGPYTAPAARAGDLLAAFASAAAMHMLRCREAFLTVRFVLYRVSQLVLTVFKLDFGPVLKPSLLADQPPQLLLHLGNTVLTLLIEGLDLRSSLLGGAHPHGVQ